MLLRFIGEYGSYNLKTGLVYPCKVYTKDNFIWVRVRSYALKFPKRYVRIPYTTIESLYSEWRAYGEWWNKSKLMKE